MSDPVLILKILLLLGVANGTPIFAKNLLKNRFAMPVDCNLVLPDGQPLLGSSKTFRGLVVSIFCTACAAFLLDLGWSMGVAIAAFSMLGDLLSSFVKRRLRLKPHAQAFGLDQIPEALLPLLAVQANLGLTVTDIAILLIAFVVLEVILSRVLYRLGIRDRPY